MKHGKLENQNIIYAELPLIIDGEYVFTNDDEIFLSQGWKKVIETPYPTDGKTYQSSWTENATEITRVWTEIPTPPYQPTEIEKLRSDVEYLSMMTDIPLEVSADE